MRMSRTRSAASSGVVLMPGLVSGWGAAADGGAQGDSSLVWKDCARVQCDMPESNSSSGACVTGHTISMGFKRLEQHSPDNLEGEGVVNFMNFADISPFIVLLKASGPLPAHVRLR